MVEMDVQLSWKDLYDYNLRHTYTSLAGILTTIVGLIGVVLSVYKISGGSYGTYVLMLIVAAILIIYTPLMLLLRSKQTFLSTPAFKTPLKYTLDENGVTVSQGQQSETCSWDNIVKAVSTGRSIILYTSKNNATIIPKAEAGDSLPLVIQTIASNLPPKKNRIKS